MDELIAFLRARYDEREDAALDVRRGHPSPWSVEDASVRDAEGHPVVLDEYHQGALGYIALNDPDRVLADVAGKRKIVDMAEAQPGYWPDNGRDDIARHWDEAMQVTMTEILHHLAGEFAGHPDYDRRHWGPLSSGNPVPE